MKKGNEMENISNTIALEDRLNDELSTQTAATLEVRMTVI